MSMTLLGWLLIASSIALSARLAVSLQSRGTRSEPFDLDAWLRSSGAKVNQALRGAAGTLMATAAVFALVAGIGTAISYRSDPSATRESEQTDDAILSQLGDYARSLGPDETPAKAASGELLPDVNTMIEQLAARLVAAPDDAKGWRMLGWSYFNTGRYDEASTAYAKAVELDPGSAEIKRAYDEARSKASEAANPQAATRQDTTAAGE
ncbi:MAG: tetratricopeptide repeat protein [Rhizobiales bacterium]|nr:tetratricopeptide repeat protein [Hyphomicrobiales bacterium]